MTCWPARLVLPMAVLTTVAAFNMSPQPNLKFHQPPITNAYQPKTRSSYFGYTINMREKSILVGAPRAQSNLLEQLNINEPGAIYKCSIDRSDCENYVFEKNGNIAENTPLNTYLNGETRDGQWLGASMDGGPLDSSQFVVCAPRMYTNARKTQFGNGICYWTSETAGQQQPTTEVAKIKPLTLLEDQFTYYRGSRQFVLGEQGLSAHITENGKEILIGSPGVWNWKGTVIRIWADNLRSDVPTPLDSIKDDNSYFGYAVSSGNFGFGGRDKLWYVASAPQGNGQLGEIHIFDMVDNGASISIAYTLHGDQMGEYFGYALVVDDFNGDTWPDIAVSAPFHAHDDGAYETGAVYVFLNDHGTSFNRPLVLESDYKKNGRFGSALSKLGDINADGYNDLAVGAPFEESGAVYIFLGGPSSGLFAKPSQKLVSPVVNKTTAPMFGHGLSKGSDTDGNHYLDLAIGAPGADTVFIYKTYPVGKLLASITAERNSLLIIDTNLILMACWKMETKFPLKKETNIFIEILLDKHDGRITYNGKNTIAIIKTASNKEQCQKFNVNVKYEPSLVFRHFIFGINFNVIDVIPNNTTEFCTSCIATNPGDVSYNQSQASYSTGCESSPCASDLHVKSTLSSTTFVLGSAKQFAIVYTIHNSGENAFLSQLLVRLFPKSLSFMTIPPSCVRSSTWPSEMMCTLNKGQPLVHGNDTYIRILLDTSLLSGNEFNVSVEASSNGNEVNATDNKLVDSVPLIANSQIEINANTSMPQFGLQKGPNVVNVTHAFEFRNIGPSAVDELGVMVLIPVKFMAASNVTMDQLLHIKNLTIMATYERRNYEVDWTDDPKPSQNVSDPSELVDAFVASLPVNRTIHFDCDVPNVECIQAHFTVSNFKVGIVPIIVSLNLSVDLSPIESVFIYEKDIFLLRTSTHIVSKSGSKRSTTSVVSSRPYLAVFRYSIQPVPSWMYILSAVFGLIVFLVITYGMFKLGFFKRPKKKELKELKRKSQAFVQQQQDNELLE